MEIKRLVNISLYCNVLTNYIHSGNDKLHM